MAALQAPLPVPGKGLWCKLSQSNRQRAQCVSAMVPLSAARARTDKWKLRRHMLCWSLWIFLSCKPLPGTNDGTLWSTAIGSLVPSYSDTACPTAKKWHPEVAISKRTEKEQKRNKKRGLSTSIRLIHDTDTEQPLSVRKGTRKWAFEKKAGNSLKVTKQPITNNPRNSKET